MAARIRAITPSSRVVTASVQTGWCSALLPSVTSPLRSWTAMFATNHRLRPDQTVATPPARRGRRVKVKPPIGAYSRPHNQERESGLGVMNRACFPQCWDSDVDAVAHLSAELITFCVEMRECEIDSFDFALPAFDVGAFAAGDEVAFDFGQSRDHFRIDMKHRAADASVLVRARRCVRSSAGAEFDFSFVEVFFEFCPFFCGDGVVFLGGAHRSSAL